MSPANKINDALNLFGNMGRRYVSFRLSFELKKRLGLLKRAFPVDVTFKHFISLADWKKSEARFFFSSKEGFSVPDFKSDALKKEAEDIRNGRFVFFNAAVCDLGKNYDWITNPDTNHTYDISKHWTEISDYSKEAGDIKYVWEKSRFSYLYTLIRYDQHFKEDQSQFLFAEIADWIDKNPINRGPNYRCSQEMSLRILNWTFALQYYKQSPNLTEELFGKIMHSIYWHARHVFANIDFSRIAVRNNHAITESVALYIVGIMYPFFPEAEKWKTSGKKWFEEEIAYQVYDDGTYLQFAHNYERVVVQLLTWAIRLNQLNDKPFADVVYDRARKALTFLYSCMNDEHGQLPNYGNNDGALFMKFSSNDFRDYRPQLEAMAAVLNIKWNSGSFEDKYWYGSSDGSQNAIALMRANSFDTGGFYLMRDDDSLSFIRCGSHKDRPAHADNLHLDIWYKGQNILRDAGSYRYNTDDETLKYFFGTASHNTVMLNGFDQMKKGARFIWYHWSQAEYAGIHETEDYTEFKGCIHAFRHVGRNIQHTRTVRKYKRSDKWEVHDVLQHDTAYPLNQLWNISPEFLSRFKIYATDGAGNTLLAKRRQAWYSGYYGIREPSEQLVFSTDAKEIFTIIELS